MSDINNYEIILNKFHDLEFCEKSIIKDRIESDNHIVVRKLLSKYNIAKPWDYNRACGVCNYFDIAEDKTIKIINSNSKLIVTRPSLSSDKPLIYVYQNWYDKFIEIQEKIVKRGYYNGFKTNAKKIKAWYEEENVLRLGNKKTGSVYIEFKIANLNSLIKQKYYYTNKETAYNLHLSYQGQLCALGVYFNFKTKLARGEKNKKLYNINLNTVAVLSIEDLDLKNLKEEKSREQIDLTDVIWAENNGKIIATFEVEFQGKWQIVLDKFKAIKKSRENYGNDIYYIVVGNNPINEYNVISQWVNSIGFNSELQGCKIKYLSIQNLVELLLKRDKETDRDTLMKEFFNSGLLLDIKVKPLYT